MIYYQQVWCASSRNESKTTRKNGNGFLAVANLKKTNEWRKIDNSHALKTRETIRYWNNYFHQQISQSYYDNIRRKDLKLIVIAGIILPSAANPNSARNDGTISMNNKYYL
ncbi:hypothetical protein [Okeania sp.]|uniref:hypothetical protein n=1 Tax=Okeania sp. TaxID=3100323 RepID=UPI0035C8D221